MIAPPTLVRKLAGKRKESQLQAACLAVFRGYGIIAFPANREKGGRNRASHVGFKGLPDICGTIPGSGRSFYCEVKRRGAIPSPHQVAALRMLAQAGAFVCLVHDVEEAQDAAREALRAVTPKEGR